MLGRSAARRLLLLTAAAFAAACSGQRDSPKPRAAPAADDSSPSRFELVFEREVAGNLDLYRIPAGGGPEQRLTDDPAEDGFAR